MNLEYKDLYKDDVVCEFKRNFFYNENTNVFSYYIIKSILMYNLEDFIFWCVDNNMNLIDFYKTNKNVNKFIEFIISKFNKKSFLKSINDNKKIFDELNKNNKFYNSTKMSLLEIK